MGKSNRALVACLFFLSAHALAAQEASAPFPGMEEAPRTLYTLMLEDENVSLEVSGFWESKIASSFGFVVAPDGTLTPSTAQPFLFQNQPDLYLILWLYEQYYLEARFANSLADIRYATGFVGKEGEYLEYLRLGNNGIVLPAYPFFPFSSGGMNSFGALARFGDERFETSALVRYDQTSLRSKSYMGSSEIKETVIRPDAFLKGRFFVVGGGISNVGLAVYAEATGGIHPGDDGSAYRKMAPSEYSIDFVSGFIAFASTHAEKLAIGFLGATSTDQILIDGTVCIPLSVAPPSAYPYPVSDRRMLAYYRYPGWSGEAGEGRGATVFVRDADSGTADPAYECVVHEDGTIEIVGGSPSSRPFESLMPWLYLANFGNPEGDKDKYSPSFDREIVVVTLERAGSFVLEANAIPGSIVVTRNGTPYHDFAFDPDSSTLSFPTAVSSAERIDIAYSVPSEDRSSGALLAGVVGVWTISESESAFAGIGTRWALPGSSYSSGSDVQSGTIVAAGGWAYSADAVEAGAAGAMSYLKVDATDRYRIEGFAATGSSSFQPEDYAASAFAANAYEAADQTLLAAFPSMAEEGIARALWIDSIAGTFTMKKQYAPIPLYRYSAFDFFVRAEGLAAGSILALRIGEGNALVVTLPMDGIGSGWRRIHVDYVAKTVTAFGSESDAGVVVSGAGVVRDATVQECGTVSIGLSGSTSGTLRLAYFDLRGSAGSFSLAARGSFSYGEESDAAEGWFVKARAACALQDSSYASGLATARFSTEAFLAELSANALLDGSGFLYAANHAFELGRDAFPAYARESFSFDPAGAASGHSAEIGLSFEDAFEMNARWLERTWTMGGSYLSQTWAVELGAGEGTFAANAQAQVDTSAPPALPASYPEVWLSSWAFFLPYENDPLSRRSSSLSLSFGSETERILSCSLSETTAGGLYTDATRLALSLRLGSDDFSVRPFISKTSSSSEAAASSTLADDVSLAFESFAASSPLWLSLPVYDFFDPDLGARFVSATDGMKSASWSPELGVSVAREPGSTLWELFAPASVEASVKRVLRRGNDTVSDSIDFEATNRGAAINLFGSLGSMPLGLGFESDEYLWALIATLSFPKGEDAPRFTATHQLACRLYSGASELAIASDFAFSYLPKGTAFREKAVVSFVVRSGDGWLSAIVRWMLGPSPVPVPTGADAASLAPKAEPGLDAEPAATAAETKTDFLETLRTTPGKTKDSFGLTASYGRKESGIATLGFEQSYDSRYSIGLGFQAFASVSLLESFTLSTGASSFAAELELGIRLSF